MHSGKSLLSTSKGLVNSRFFSMVGDLVWEKGRKQSHPQDKLWLKESSECGRRPEDPAAPSVTHLSPEATMLSISADAECCGQV